MKRVPTIVLIGALALGLALPARCESFSLDSEASWQSAVASGTVRAPTGDEELSAIAGMQGQ